MSRSTIICFHPALFFGATSAPTAKVHSFERYWQKKLGGDSPQLLELEELLRDRNPLLANFGRIGREMACQIEESEARTHASYALPEHLKELNGDLPYHDDLILTESKSPLHLLHALQADLLLMRNPQEAPPFNFERSDLSSSIAYRCTAKGAKWKYSIIIY